MVELTRLNCSSLVVNSDLIQYVESAPDTTLTLINGEKIVVRESPTEIIDRAIAYRVRIIGEAARQSPESMGFVSGAALRALSECREIARQDEIEIESTIASSKRRRMQR